MNPHSFYLAGPMTGIPQFNFPAFDAAAAELRDQGYEIISPAELDDPDTREAALASPDGAPGSGSADGETYGTFLARDVKLVIDEVEGVVVLPDWFKSRGARIEVFTAATMGKPIYEYDGVDTFRHAPYRFSELAEHLKPGDPGAGDQHSRSVGPPVEAMQPYSLALDEPIADAINRAKAAGETPRKIYLAWDGEGTDDEAHPSRLFGLPVFYTTSLKPGHFYIISKAREATREPGHIIAEMAARGELPKPDGEERITDDETGGAKGRKPIRMDLIPWEPVWEVARVYGFGESKYPGDETGPNYLKGFDWSLSYGAAFRHLSQWASGEDHDPEFGTHHLAHVAWHCFALMMFQWHDRGRDDRLTTLTGLAPVDAAQRTGRSEAARK